MTDAAPPVLITGSYQRTEGLAAWRWDGLTGVEHLGSADIDSPSYVCVHPRLPMLYTVSELDEGTLTTLAIGDHGTLTPLGSMPTGGAQPCWVTTDPAGMALLIANYDVSGAASSMAVVGLSEDGIPVGDAVVTAHSGSGPVADRQSGAHVHQVVPTADGHVLASDLGADELVEYLVDQVPGAPRGTLTVTEVGRTAMPAGSGPRHIALAADGVTGFVSSELDGTVTMIRRGAGNSADTDNATDAGRWQVVGQTPCSHRGESPHDNAHRSQDPGRSPDPGFTAPSHVALTASDRYLLVTNRGPNTLAVLDVASRIDEGLDIVAESPVAAGPRDFTVYGDLVLVAGQQDGLVEVHRLDPVTGELRREGTWQVDGERARIPDVSRIAFLHG